MCPDFCLKSDFHDTPSTFLFIKLLKHNSLIALEITHISLTQYKESRIIINEDIFQYTSSSVVSMMGSYKKLPW